MLVVTYVHIIGPQRLHKHEDLTKIISRLSLDLGTPSPDGMHMSLKHMKLQDRGCLHSPHQNTHLSMHDLVPIQTEAENQNLRGPGFRRLLVDQVALKSPEVPGYTVRSVDPNLKCGPQFGPLLFSSSLAGLQSMVSHSCMVYSGYIRIPN